MEQLERLGIRAREAETSLRLLTTEKKNQVLHQAADDLQKNARQILAENEKDMENGRKNGMSAGLLDRLALTE